MPKKIITVFYIGPECGFKAIQGSIPDHINVITSKPELKSVSKKIKYAHAFIDASMKIPINQKILRLAKKLQVISTATTGSDHIDMIYAKSIGIKVFTLKEDKDLLQNLTPAAELSWALLMAVARKITAASKHVNSGLWNRDDFPGIMLKEKTLGIVGCGRLGQWMARYGSAFGMNVQGYDPFVKPWPKSIKKISLDQLFMTSDFISIHVHLTNETKGLISSDLIGIIKKGAILINTSRGKIIDELALLNALKSNQIAGAGLDVLDGEPYIKAHPLVEYSINNSNLIITPHCGGYSPDAVKIVCQRAMEKVITYLN